MTGIYGPDLGQVIAALGRCTLPPGTAHKRFIRNLQHATVWKLTERQHAYVMELAWRYRRQMPAHLVPARADRDAAQFALKAAGPPPENAALRVEIEAKAAELRALLDRVGQTLDHEWAQSALEEAVTWATRHL